MTDTPTQFEPSANQVRVRNVFHEYNYDITVVEACRASKIGRDTYYDWFHKPGFADWWIQQATEFFGRALPRVYAALLKMSTGKHPGNHAAAKILLDRFDGEFVPKTAQEHTVDDKRPEEMTIDEIFAEGLRRRGVKVGDN